MRAAVLRELGTPPELGDVPEPARSDGDTLVRVRAAPLNPIDIAVGSGRFYGGHPDLPYVPGSEAVGEVVESDSLKQGELVWVNGAGLGQKRDGTLAERVVAPDGALVPLPAEIEPAQAAALGIAGLAGWLPLARRAPVREGERVLVLGATGAVGLIAVQAARIFGAARIVAAGRSPQGLRRAEEAGADAVVKLDEKSDLAAAFREACGGDGPTLVIDPLWGKPFEAAAEAAAPGARLVNIGQSAGPEATLTSAAVRGKQLEILGYSNFGTPREVLVDAYLDLVKRAVEGEIRLPLEEIPLDDVATAWKRQAEGPDTKIVVVP